MVRRKRRNIRPKNLARSRSNRPTRNKKKATLKERLLTMGIWALGLINLVLIASIASDFFASTNEQPVSMNLPKESRNQPAEPEPEQPPQNQPITVEVLNACGVQGLAHAVTEYLRSKNFDVVNVGNYEGGFDMEETFVLDRTSLSNENASQVAEALGVEKRQVKPLLEGSVQLMVTVLIGKDYKKLKSYEEIARIMRR